ncbi:CAP domain-containing protein, partial [Gorgonomyces haynaldii]
PQPTSTSAPKATPPVQQPQQQQQQQTQPQQASVPCLTAHNNIRAALGLKPFKWNGNLINAATKWANQLASSGAFQHSQGRVGPYGENLYQGSPNCVNAVSAWLLEKKNYFGQAIGDGNFANYGHFTQLIWPTTTDVGCATVGAVTVCEYSPAGNMDGIKLTR